eukprot:5110492-Ditylum_brightwellii.AAC.1
MGMPFNKVDCDQFKAYAKACRSNNKVKYMGQFKYNNHIDTYYKKFNQTITKIMLEKIALMYGFLLKWEKIYLLLINKKHILGHSAAVVGVNIKETPDMEFPDVSITNHILTVVSDTTGAAQNVANHFDDTSQTGCVMHGRKLLLKYSMGIKDNHVEDLITGTRSISKPEAQ